MSSHRLSHRFFDSKRNKGYTNLSHCSIRSLLPSPQGWRTYLSSSPLRSGVDDDILVLC